MIPDDGPYVGVTQGFFLSCTSFGRILKPLIQCIFLATYSITWNSVRQIARKISANRPEASSVSKSEQKDGLVNGFWSHSGNFFWMKRTTLPTAMLGVSALPRCATASSAGGHVALFPAGNMYSAVGQSAAPVDAGKARRWHVGHDRRQASWDGKEEQQGTQHGSLASGTMTMPDNKARKCFHRSVRRAPA